MSVSRMFDRRLRGFRVVNVVAAVVLAVLMVGLYLAKTRAARDSAAIARIERQMAGEKNRIRMLQAEAARLEKPERIERLATEYLAMAPATAAREATPEALAQLASGPHRASAPAPVAAPVVVAVAPQPATVTP